MLGHPNHYGPGGASAYPVVMPGTNVPLQARAIGADIPYGSVVVPCLDDSVVTVDIGQIDGDRSPLMNVKLAATADVAFPKTSLYGVAVQEDGIEEFVGSDVDSESKGYVANVNVTVQVRIVMVAGGFRHSTPLMADLANPGRAILANGTAKTIALVAQDVPEDADLVGQEVLVWVHLNGVHGFGSNTPNPA